MELDTCCAREQDPDDQIRRYRAATSDVRCRLDTASGSDPCGHYGAGVRIQVRWRRLEIANMTALIAARALKNVQDSVA